MEVHRFYNINFNVFAAVPEFWEGFVDGCINLVTEGKIEQLKGKKDWKNTQLRCTNRDLFHIFVM